MTVAVAEALFPPTSDTETHGEGTVRLRSQSSRHGSPAGDAPASSSNTPSHYVIAAEPHPKSAQEHDLDAQHAISEYYFSEDEQSENEMGEGANVDDSDAFAEYYGYSSASDLAIESLFLVSSDTHEDYSDSNESLVDELESGSLVFQMAPLLAPPTQPPAKSSAGTLSSGSPEESFNEQLAKITPQILAAISVAAKSLSHAPNMMVPVPTVHEGGWHMRTHRHSHSQSFNTNSSSIYTRERATEPRQEKKDTMLRLEEVMDTKKLSALLSTSPPLREQPDQSSRSNVPIHAFRRSRRSSIQNKNHTVFAGALRQNSLANCTLAAAPLHDEAFISLDRMRSASCCSPSPTTYSQQSQSDVETFAIEELSLEWTQLADDESDDVSKIDYLALGSAGGGGGGGGGVSSHIITSLTLL